MFQIFVASPVLLYTGSLFIISLLVYLAISLTIYWRPYFRARSLDRLTPPSDQELPGVSVIVYSYNQAEYLQRNIPILLASDYPDFEVIVVDDGSNDDTEEVLTIIEQRSDAFYHTRLDQGVRTVSRRKLALLLGIKAARHEVLLFTHAQCVPTSPQWIRSMVRHLSTGVGVVLGPVAMEDRVGLMSRFYAFDVFHRMLRVLGLTLALRPYAGCGMNMAMRKSLFYEVDGFRKHLNLHPGEDDLLVAEAGTRGGLAVECSASSVVVSQERPMGYGWRLLRQNRGFTSRFYPLFPQLLDGIDVCARMLFVVSGIVLLFLLWELWIPFSIVAVILLLRALHQMLLYRITSSRLKMHRFFFSSLAFEPIIPFVDLYFRLYGMIRHKGFEVGRI